MELVSSEASTAAAVDYEDYLYSESPRLPGEASGRVDYYEVAASSEAASSVDFTKPVLFFLPRVAWLLDREGGEGDGIRLTDRALWR